MIKDTMQLNGFNKVKMPKLKGHVKVTLHNCKTGKNEVVEGDNIVTHAMRDIFANNYLGCLNYTSSGLLPIYSNWFGGVLAYEDAFSVAQGETDPDPDDYFCQANSINRLVAHAGDITPSTAQIVQEDLQRGSPLEVVTGVDSNGRPFVKQSWEWGSTQGNGQISAIALTHKDTGNAGLGNNSSTFASFVPLASIGNVPNATMGVISLDMLQVQYDEIHALNFHIGTDEEYQPSVSSNTTSFATKKLTIQIKRLPYSHVGLFETTNAISMGEREFTVELSDFTLYSNPCYYFDYANKKLWIFSNMQSTSPYYNNTVCNYAIIDCENESIDTEGTITSDTSNLAPIGFYRGSSGSSSGGSYDDLKYINIIKEGDFVFLPTTTGSVSFGGNWSDCYSNVNGFKRINVTTQSQQSSISFSAQNNMATSMGHNGIYITGNRVVNGSTGYPCSMFDSLAPQYHFSEWNKVSSYAVVSVGSNPSRPRYILANKMVNTTKFNLSSSVIKSAAKSMQIEYTLTETQDE